MVDIVSNELYSQTVARRFNVVYHFIGSFEVEQPILVDQTVCQHAVGNNV